MYSRVFCEMKKWLAILFVLLAGVGTALFFTAEPSPPPGFVSIRSLPGFQDAALLERAWSLPVAKLFPRPIVSQRFPWSCGPASVGNVLNSYSPLTPTLSPPGEREIGGFTLSELGALAKVAAPEWTVTELRPATLEAFREELRHANDPRQRLIINFTRRPLFGTGGGHHSPIGGYLETEDLVFVLDVNERFGPWLVPGERLFEAMNTVDSSSGVKRGLLKLRLP
jgi:hypothetical protein